MKQMEKDVLLEANNSNIFTQTFETEKEIDKTIIAIFKLRIKFKMSL